MANQPNPDWTRWIVSSIIEHFSSTVMAPQNIPFITEGIDERDDTFMSEEDRAELRINGPFSRELSARYWRIWVDINILVTSYLGGQEKDAYTLERNLGLIAEFTDTSIPIKRHGLGVGDDGTTLGCLRPRNGKRDSVRTINFGQMSKTDRLRQSQIDARYAMTLCE